MTSTHLLTAIAVATAFASAAATAQSARAQPDKTAAHVAQDSHGLRSGPVLQAVPHSSLPDQASNGWQYYSDPRALHAVVISPSGEYFLSLGDGPRHITGPAGYALKSRSTRS